MSIGEELEVGRPTAFLNAFRFPFRVTGLRRGCSLIDLIPPKLLGGKFIWSNTDVGPLVLRIDDTGTRELLVFGHQLHDMEETRIARAILPSARGMIDVGASYGWYSKLAASLMNPRALKIALEANPDVAACLQRSLHGVPEFHVLNVAATDSDRPVRLYCAKSSGLSSAVRAVGTPIVVRGLPLDDIWPTGRPVDFIKCDVEGGELDVLRGARRIRSRYDPIWMLEFDETFLNQAEIKPDELADEVSDMLCWWRSDEAGWLVAKNLGGIVGEKHLVNVFLVPPIRANRFRTWIKAQARMR